LVVCPIQVRQFESRAEEYQRNKKRWSEESHPSTSHQEGSQESPGGSALPGPRTETSKPPQTGQASPEQSKAAKRKRRVTFNLDNLTDRGEGGEESRPPAEGASHSRQVAPVLDVSPTLVEALSALRSQLLALQERLDEELCTKLWRKTVAAIDQLLLDKVNSFRPFIFLWFQGYLVSDHEKIYWGGLKLLGVP
jgi:hypothetical protein